MKLDRRALLGSAAVATAGAAAGYAWWHGGNAPIAEADRAARTPHEIYDRGLIGVEHSGWTMPEGVHPAHAGLEADIEADFLVVGAGLAGSSLALHLAEAGHAVAVIEARQPGWGASGRDANERLVLSAIPSVSAPEDAQWHFRNQLEWLHRVWPQTKAMKIELETYWTGRVALRDREFPGVFEAAPGLYGLMFFNAWGNVMAPLMGKLFAQGLAADRPDTLPFPLEKPLAVSNPGKQDRIIRHLLIPASRLGQDIGLL